MSTCSQEFYENCDLPPIANRLMLELTGDVDVELPSIDLDSPKFNVPWDQNSAVYQDVKALVNEDLTTREVDGQGTFDALMSGISAHLQREYEAGRITGDDFSKAYIALSESAMKNATEFVISKDSVYWSSFLSQAQAMAALVQLEIEKMKLALTHFEVYKVKTEFATAKANLALAASEQCTSKYILENILPLQKTKLNEEISGTQIENNTKTYQLSKILPGQHAGILADNQIKQFNLTSLMPAQQSNLAADTSIKNFTVSSVLPAQVKLTLEQYEVQRAQTSDSRSDSKTVMGTLGKQKELYTQQIEAYKRNAELNAARVVTDAWITQKTLDADLTAPNVLTNDSVQAAVTTMLRKTGL